MLSSEFWMLFVGLVLLYALDIVLYFWLLALSSKKKRKVKAMTPEQMVKSVVDCVPLMMMVAILSSIVEGAKPVHKRKRGRKRKGR